MAGQWPQPEAVSHVVCTVGKQRLRASQQLSYFILFHSVQGLAQGKLLPTTNVGLPMTNVGLPSLVNLI